MAVSFDRARLAPLKDSVAIVGVGETEVVLQYRGRGGESPDSQRFTITVSAAAR